MRRGRSIALPNLLLGGLFAFATAPSAYSAEPANAIAAHASARGVRITLDSKAADKPISGRLYLFLSQSVVGEPMRGPNWFSPEPFFRLDVTDFGPGDSRTIDDNASGFPNGFGKLPVGSYRAQAILDHDFYHPHPADGVGNVYSEVVAIEVGGPSSVELQLSKVVARRDFPESKWAKEITLKSEALSRFHKREVFEFASVALPASYYEEPVRKYPVMYVIPGFGGDHRDALKYSQGPPARGVGEVEFIRVYLSGRCKWGHHVYADSATNGPRGEALVREMIPHIDKAYRTDASSRGRFVAGHSSGGWSSLWLQINYPDMFSGVWSSSPDPVDFRDFQRVDLYADPPLSLYRDEKDDSADERRPIARRGYKPVLWFDSFAKMDDTLGRGGQLRSFEAVFSPLDAQGLPAQLWNRESGRIDPNVAKAWQKYDIGLKLQHEWKTLEPQLRGKLHITMGTRDTFFLEGATRLLAERLKELGSDAEITWVEGADHGSILTAEYFARVRRQMSDAYQRHEADAR